MSEDRLLNFINGEFVPPSNGKHFESYNPATGMVLHLIPDSSAEDIDAAVAAAKAALPGWSKTSREARSALLHRLASLLEAKIEPFAHAESEDQGKTLSQAQGVEIPRAVKNLRFFADLALHQEEKATRMEGLQSFTQTVPIGVVGLISPWNLPLYLLTWKLAPALVMGNCVIAKPSELTSLTASMLCHLIKEAGFPPGVVNLVFGYGATAGAAMVLHPEIKAISFTGGTITGRRIQEMASKHNKKISLELGGKNANVIFADCDMDATVKTSIRSSFANQGEICLCGSRILVERPVYAEFIRRLTSEVEALKMGDPKDPANFMGALVSAQHREKVQSYIDLARAEGCTVHAGGTVTVEPGFEGGYFLRPTVISNVALDSRLMREEIFGPVVCVVPFDTEEEAISIANATEYGLSASVWTQDFGKAHHVASALDVGTVWVNCWMVRDLAMPFGGMKASGIGREGGKHSLDFFSEIKTISFSV